MAKVTYASLKLKPNTEVKTVKFGDAEIEVKQYLSIEDKYDIIMSTVNNAKDSSESQDETATSETSDVPVVSDEAKILSEYEVEEITENSQKLSLYNLAIYVEAMDETEISEQVTADNAKTFYQNVFGVYQP